MSVFFAEVPSHLQTAIDAGMRYLVATRRQVWLASDQAIFTPDPAQQGGGAEFHVIDLCHFAKLFERVGDGRDCFTHAELQQVTRLNEVVLNRLLRDANIQEIGGTYDLQGTFAAIICSVLMRKGVPYKVAARAARFALHGEANLCKKP